MTAAGRAPATRRPRPASALPFAPRLRFAALVAVTGAMSLAWNVVATPLRFVLPRRTGMRIGRTAISFIYRTVWRLAVGLDMMRIDSGALDALKDEPGGLVVAANHPTMLDAMIVVAGLPRGVCIMKAELLANPFLGAGARLARYIGNDAGRSMVRDAAASLVEGGQLVLFPEGTRTVGAPVNRFKPGIALIAKLGRAPIQTVFITTESPYLTKGWPLLKAPPSRVAVRVCLGERFAPAADHRAALRRLEAYFARELASTAPPR